MRRLRELLIALLIAMLALLGTACDVGEEDNGNGGGIEEEEDD